MSALTNWHKFTLEVCLMATDFNIEVSCNIGKTLLETKSQERTMVISKTRASKLIRNHVHSFDLIKFSLKSSVNFIMILLIGLAIMVTSSSATTTRTMTRNNMATDQDSQEAMFGRRLAAINQLGGNSQQLVTSTTTTTSGERVAQFVEASETMRLHHHPHQTSSQVDLSQADQMDDPTYATPPDQDPVDFERISAADQLDLDQFRGSVTRRQANFNNRDITPNQSNENEDAVDRNSAERNLFAMSNHNTQLRAMRDMFERRHLDGNNNQHRRNNNRNHNNNNNIDNMQQGNPLQSSQELSPISIGLDNVSPFAMPPFQMGMNDGGAAQAPPPPPLPSMGVHMKPQMSNADNLDAGLEPTLPFGLNPLPHLMGFQSAAFDGPQRGDQSAHSNHHTAAATQADVEPANGAGAGSGSGQKSWPKIFRFTDGRINLSDFEKQKKIRLSNKQGENHIESAPIMFDGRPLKRKSFLILHGGVFPGN